MKRFNPFLTVLLFLTVAFSACDERDFEMPPFFEPHYGDTATMSIAAFKTKYAAVTAAEITDTVTISGVVVANDASGNMYKELTIMDSTGGIKLAINQGDMYTQYRLGQRVYLECRGLWVGKYGGYMQIGGPYNTGIGQMTWETAEAHLFKDGWPNPSDKLLTPETISMDVVASEANLGKLVKLENVTFTNGGLEVCAAAAADGSTQTLSKTLKSSVGTKTITVRLSSAADFANKTLPSGNGNLTGILSVYNNTYQFTPRDSMDFEFVGFGKGYVPHGLGTVKEPYSIPWLITNINKNLSGWVSGYIVGALKPGMNESNPVTSNTDIQWQAPFMNNYVVIAKDSTENDWKKCILVNLPDSTMRRLVNLADHPENLKKKITVLGRFSTILGMPSSEVSVGTSGEYVMGTVPSGEALPFTESFLSAAGLNAFTTFNFSGTQAWTASASYGATMSGYLSYVNYPNEDWLISPSLLLIGVINSTVTFSHANYFQAGSTPVSSDFTLWISTDYTSGSPYDASWKQLTIPTYNATAKSWTFLSSGSIAIPAEYLGKSVRLAFKYKSTNTAASTWEIKNLEVKGTSALQ